LSIGHTFHIALSNLEAEKAPQYTATITWTPLTTAGDVFKNVFSSSNSGKTKYYNVKKMPDKSTLPVLRQTVCGKVTLTTSQD